MWTDGVALSMRLQFYIDFCVSIWIWLFIFMWLDYCTMQWKQLSIFHCHELKNKSELCGAVVMAPGRFCRNSRSIISKLIMQNSSLGTPVKLLWGECHTSPHWVWQCLSAVRQLAITWANVDPDLCRHIASLQLKSVWHLTFVIMLHAMSSLNGLYLVWKSYLDQPSKLQFADHQCQQSTLLILMSVMFLFLSLLILIITLWYQKRAI